MKNEYLENPLEVGTVLKEELPTGGTEYYIVGDYFIYANDYDFPKIRPHKFIFDACITVASEEEKEAFVETLRKNHLIWDEGTGKVTREYEKLRLSVMLKLKPGIDKEELIRKLNTELESAVKPFFGDVYEAKLEDF